MDVSKLSENIATREITQQQTAPVNNGGILDKIYNNFKWIMFITLAIFAAILVILAFVEFGKDDENEKQVKIMFGVTFAIGCVMLIGLVGIYYYKDSQKRVPITKKAM